MNAKYLALAVAATAVTLACAGAMGASPPRVVALSFNVATTSNNPLSGVQLATRAGVRGAYVSYTWSSLEPAREQYALDDLAQGLRYLGGTLHLRLLLGIQVLNTTENESPRDLRARAFDAPQTKLRFRRLLVSRA